MLECLADEGPRIYILYDLVTDYRTSSKDTLNKKNALSRSLLVRENCDRRSYHIYKNKHQHSINCDCPLQLWRKKFQKERINIDGNNKNKKAYPLELTYSRPINGLKEAIK